MTEKKLKKIEFIKVEGCHNPKKKQVHIYSIKKERNNIWISKSKSILRQSQRKNANQLRKSYICHVIIITLGHELMFTNFGHEQFG